MLTECNCDMPEWAYLDWLREQGWEVDEEEFIVFPGISTYGSHANMYEKDTGGGIFFTLLYPENNVFDGYQNSSNVHLVERDNLLSHFHDYFHYGMIGNGCPHRIWGYNITSWLEDKT